MINAVSVANTTSFKKKQSNNLKKEEIIVPYSTEYLASVKQPKKKSKAAAIAKYATAQFVAGAVVSGVFDGVTNLYRAVAKNKPLIGLKDFAGRAGYTGACFAVIGLVFTGIATLLASKKK